MVTILGELVARHEDFGGYIIYVFKLQDKEEIKRLDSTYLMCTQFPNWDHREIQLGEIGYVAFEEIIAGVSKWFDGERMVSYNYNMIQFIRFIPKPQTKKFEYKLD